MRNCIGLTIVAAVLVVACASPSPKETQAPSPTAPSPTAPSPTAPSRTLPALAVACDQAGGYSAECLAVAAAAAKVVPISLDAGIRADVISKGTWWHVVFTTSSGQQASADVVWSPVGTLAGVNGAAGP